MVFFSELSGFHSRKQRTFKESVDGSNFGTDNADYKKAENRIGSAFTEFEVLVVLTGMLISFVCLLILLHQLKVYEKPFGCYNVTQGSCDRCPFTLFFLLYGARAAAEVVIYEE